MNKNSITICTIFFIGIWIFIGIIFLYWSLPPYFEMKADLAFMHSSLNSNPDTLIEKENIFSDHNYLQPEIVHFMINDYLFSKYASEKIYSDVPLLKFAAGKLEETLKYQGNYPNHFFTLGKIYDILAIQSSPDEKAEMLSKAELAYKKALDLYPENQRTLYAYTTDLAVGGKVDEALMIANKTVDNDPRVLESHYYYAIMLIKKGGDKNTDLSLQEFETAFNGGFSTKDELPKVIYDKFLLYYYGKKDINNLSKVLSRLIMLNPKQAQIYQNIIDYIKENKAIPALNIK